MGLESLLGSTAMYAKYRSLLSALGIVIWVLTVSGCDSGAAIRRSLAQCELSPRARIHDPFGAEAGWDDDYLELCMQARGFVVDDNLKWAATSCAKLDHPAIEDECYRRDSMIGKWEARIGER